MIVAKIINPATAIPVTTNISDEPELEEGEPLLFPEEPAAGLPECCAPSGFSKGADFSEGGGGDNFPADNEGDPEETGGGGLNLDEVGGDASGALSDVVVESDGGGGDSEAEGGGDDGGEDSFDGGGEFTGGGDSGGGEVGGAGGGGDGEELEGEEEVVSSLSDEAVLGGDCIFQQR